VDSNIEEENIVVIWRYESGGES